MLSLSRVSTCTEPDEFSFGDDFAEGFDYAEEDYDDGLEEASIPDCLKFPWSAAEPVLSPVELSQLDAVAMQFEVDRLLGIPALERTSHALPGHRHLTTRFVVTWRAKSEDGNAFWLRRARLVARDYAFLCLGRTDLFSPASSALQSKIIPAVFIANFHRGWQLVSLDIADAYLNCPQVDDTCTSVTINGGRMWFKLLRLIPGQRDGSQKWFYQFVGALQSGCDAELMPEVPSIFRFPPHDGGGGLVHVDDLLGTGPEGSISRMTSHLKQNYKVAVEVIAVPGDELHFLKKRHFLLSATELLIEVSPKHLDKLKALCGNPKHRKSPMPSGILPTERPDDPPLSEDEAFKYRSAIGVLLYLQADLPHAMFAIRHLSGCMSAPTRGAWSTLRHLVGYLSATSGYQVCLRANPIGHGLQVRLDGMNTVEVFSDADWAGCRSTRRSVSSSIVLCNGNFVHCSSKTQKSISLSSAESEFGAAVAASIDGILVSAMIRFLSPDPTSVPQLMIDNSAARSIMRRSGVGRVRHLDVKLLWTQAKVAAKELVIHPCPTRSNVADVGTKVLSAVRCDYLLGLMQFVDASDGYSRVGAASLDVDHNIQAIRTVCKGLAKVAKGDDTGNTARILSVILVALQASGSLAQGDVPDDDSSEEDLGSFMALCAQILGGIMAVWELNPGLCSFILQLALLASVFLGISCCRRRGTSSSRSVQVHVSSQGEVTVGVDQREPLRAPGTPGRFNQLSPAPQGRSPGTPARPINVGGPHSEAESDVLPFEDEPVVPPPVPAMPRGARSKVKSKPHPRPAAVPERPVWIAPSQGKRYRKEECTKALYMSGHLEPISRAAAEGRGYTPCKVCLPNLNL